jgi:hypothetical protein
VNHLDVEQEIMLRARPQLHDLAEDRLALGHGPELAALDGAGAAAQDVPALAALGPAIHEEHVLAVVAHTATLARVLSSR